jgi:hypothetical protein
MLHFVVIMKLSLLASKDMARIVDINRPKRINFSRSHFKISTKFSTHPCWISSLEEES